MFIFKSHATQHGFRKVYIFIAYGTDMVEIKIDISNELKEQIEVSGIKLSLLLQRLLKHLQEEKEMIDWSVKLQRVSRKGRYDELKKQRLI